MLFVENFNTDPYVNHALEEWLMENYAEDCFMLWRNQKAVLLGKNQNVHDEINLPYAKEQGIKIVRRISGGGAVYTDEGTVMFTFISQNGRGLTDFRPFTEPILAALNSWGVPAEFSGRNDLTVDGGKFSGNAQCTYGGKLLHHGTLMYSTDINEMARVLQVNELKLRDKGVASVKSRVTNLSNYLAEPPSAEDFRLRLFNNVMKKTANAVLLRLSEDEWANVIEKAASRHACPEWIYGQSPAFNIRRETKLSDGLLQVCLSVKKGRIEKVTIYGDFFGNKDISEVEVAMSGLLYNAEALHKALLGLPMEEYLSNISVEEFISAVI